jgi:hypothetical protein
MQHVEIQLVRPPVPVRPTATHGGMTGGSARYGALTRFAHDVFSCSFDVMFLNPLYLNNLFEIPVRDAKWIFISIMQFGMIINNKVKKISGHFNRN